MKYFTPTMNHGSGMIHLTEITDHRYTLCGRSIQPSWNDESNPHTIVRCKACLERRRELDAAEDAKLSGQKGVA